MNALRQKCRPKHQLLILKCYPRLPKNTTATEEIKPNGSELSYLLYYASSRRSKLTKVGTFLEKKTANDVYKVRTPAVMVTLQILDAFLGSSEVSGGKDGFGLFAPYVLRILKDVLENGASVELIETCLPVWTSFCGHQDHATLAADAEYRAMFAGVVNTWASFAMKKGGRKTLAKLAQLSVSDEIRLRKAGIEAMKAVAESQALNSDAGKHMEVVMNVVLQNLWAEDDSYLTILVAREKEHGEKDAITRGRPSITTVRTRTTEEGDARAAAGTAADADKIAEEEAGQLALECLKTVYEVDNRSQIRSATTCLLAFIAKQDSPSSQSDKSWGTTLVKMVCSWAPVQDRFVVLFTAVELLIRTPIAEEELKRQLVLAHIISKVLSSDINLIGLSIMDILLGLVQHVLLLLQIGTQHAHLNRGDITSSDEDIKAGSEKSSEKQESLQMDVVKAPSPARLQLLDLMLQCMSSLATHVYYTDQVSDMVSAILLRLKPSLAASHHPSIIASAIENPVSTAADVACNSNLKEQPNTDGFFSFDTAREVALSAVKGILTVANSSRNDGSVSRNHVSINVWEGTQWLLRDSSENVRKAYVEALCTWLQLETVTVDGQLADKTDTIKTRKENGTGGDIARRAVSNASTRHKSRKSHSAFLQLLHLAIYEEAMQRADAPDADGDFLLLHLLLTTLSQRLGINAIRSGLPMVFCLQEDIQRVASPKAKIRIGSLVHGYFASLTSAYNLGSTFIGTEIEHEISRRREHGIWLAGIQIPPMPASQIQTGPTAPISAVVASTESLKPFDHRHQFVDSLSESYTASLASPTNSPPASPTRSFSMPIFSDGSTIKPPTDSTIVAPGATRHIPGSVIEELNAVWSKEGLLAAMAAAAPKSISLSGSRTTGIAFAGNTQHSSRTEMNRGSAPFENHRHLLAAANTFPIAKSADGSPTRSVSAGNYGPSGKAASVRVAHSARGNKQTRLASRSPASVGPRSRGASVGPGGRRESAATQGNGNGHLLSATRSTRAHSVAAGSRVDELKRALATGSAVGGDAALGRMSVHPLDLSDDDDDEDSMVENDEGYPESSFGDDTDGTTGYGDNDATPRPILKNPMDDYTFAVGMPPWSQEAMDELNAQGAGITTGVGANEEESIPPETSAQSNVPALALPGTFNIPPSSSSAQYDFGNSTGGSAPSRPSSEYSSYSMALRPSSRRLVGSRNSANKAFTGDYTAGPPASSSSNKKDLNFLLDNIGIEEDGEGEGQNGLGQGIDGGQREHERGGSGIEGGNSVTPPY